MVERETSIPALWVSGLIVLPISWVMTWTFASDYALTSTAADYSFIPLLGPWMMLTEPLAGAETVAIVGGIGQLVGATLIVLGLVLRRTVRVPEVTFGDGPGAPRLSWGLGPASHVNAESPHSLWALNNPRQTGGLYLGLRFF